MGTLSHLCHRTPAPFHTPNKTLNVNDTMYQCYDKLNKASKGHGG